MADVTSRSNAVEYIVASSKLQESYLHTPLLDKMLDGVYDTDKVKKVAKSTNALID